MTYMRDVKPICDSPNEECGVFGIYSENVRDVASTVYYGLYALQHRGQEACGIAVNGNAKINYYKNMGLVPEAFDDTKLSELGEGDIAIGHVRYSTTGENKIINCQPLVFNGKCGKFAIAHNGNITNAKVIRDELMRNNILFQTEIDTEVIGTLFNKFSDSGVEEGILKSCAQLEGSFAFVLMTTDKLIAVRDHYGIRPLVLGKLGLDEYVVASETAGLDAVGAVFIRDIDAGEVLIIDNSGLKTLKLESKPKKTCIFEYVYFARPDSIIDGVSVYQARKQSGRLLAQFYPVNADIVAGVPDSAVVSARGYSETSGIPYVEALAKNRYVGRTFIQPEQGMRESAVKVKLNALKYNVQGKRIVLLDDSIVRGTTSKKIVQMLRDAGAKEVHLRISSPIVKHPCYLGIDTQSYSQLIGANRSKEEIMNYIGADSLEFLTVEQLIEGVSCGNSGCGFCVGCFSGEYPMPLDKKDVKKLILE